MTRASRSGRDRITESQWFFPTLAVIGAIVLGTLIPRLPPPTGGLARFGAATDPDAAQTLLSLVAGSVLSIAVFSFSVTLLALQIAGSQYSPRLLSGFLRDRGNLLTLSIFLGTFAYCLAVLRTIEELASFWAMLVLLLAVLASLGAFVYFINHVTRTIRVDEIMRRVERRALEAIVRNHGDAVGGVLWESPVPAVPDNAVPIAAPASGYITTLQPTPLLPLATREDVVIAFDARVGDYVAEGAPLAWVWSRQAFTEVVHPERVAPAVQATVDQGTERTLQQDAAYGLRQLVDIGVKSASEAICDPTTAVDAIGHLSVLVTALAMRRLGPEVLVDQANTGRVVVPRRDFGEYLDLAITQIRLYARDDPFVFEALLHLLRDAGLATRAEDRHAVIDAQIQAVTSQALGVLTEPQDRARIERDAETVRRSIRVQERSLRARLLARELERG